MIGFKKLQLHSNHRKQLKN